MIDDCLVHCIICSFRIHPKGEVGIQGVQGIAGLRVCQTIHNHFTIKVFHLSIHAVKLSLSFTVNQHEPFNRCQP